MPPKQRLLKMFFLRKCGMGESERRKIFSLPRLSKSPIYLRQQEGRGAGRRRRINKREERFMDFSKEEDLERRLRSAGGLQEEARFLAKN